MPTHNYARFLGEAIQGLLDQTYPHFELIVVDDASTDNTREILEGFSDDRIVLVRREECSCSAETPRNDGMAVARGELIAVADADDVSLPNRLELQVSFLRQRPEIDVLSGGAVLIREDGSEMGPPHYSPVHDQHPEEYRLDMLRGRLVIVHGALVFRRCVLNRLGGYSDFASAADLELLIRASRYFVFANLRQVLIRWRLHESSTTRTYGLRINPYLRRSFLERERLWVDKELERLATGSATSPENRVRRRAETWRDHPPPAVSVVMPTHNYGRFLGGAIRSLLGQTFGDFELIIVDDASTDETPEVLTSFTDPRIVVIRRPECSCSAVLARNDGMALARGALIAVADADDTSLPDRLARQVDFLERHRDVYLLGGGIQPVDGAGRPLGQPEFRPNFELPEMYRQTCLKTGGVIMYHTTMMFRRAVLDKVPRYNAYLAGGDLEFQLRASRYFTAHNLSGVLVYYRRHDKSTTATHGRRLDEGLRRVFFHRESLWVEKELERMAARDES